MDSLTQFAQGKQIDDLIQRFGCCLEFFNRPQKLQLRVLLINFLLGQEMMGAGYTICDAWEDSSLHLLVEDKSVVEVADILADLTIAQAEGLLQSLGEQCTVGNARLKTAVETMCETLVQHGVPQELAKTAAVILKEVDAVRDRTAEEQEIINKIHQLVIQEAA